MGIPRDLIDLLREFAAAEVEFLIIGGHAQGFHAVPRFTQDVDFWPDPGVSRAWLADAPLLEEGETP